MADVTLDDLLQSPTLKAIQTLLLAQLAVPDFPVTDWNVGGVARTLYELEAIVLEDLVSQSIPIIAGGGAADTATKDWLTILAHSWFEIDRSLSAVATQAVTLACASGFGPYTLATGQQFLTASDGSRYYVKIISGSTISGGGTLAIDAVAESPGAARGLVNAMETQLPGVTVQSAAIKVVGGVPQFGADAQTDASVLASVTSRWPALGGIATVDRVRKWALASDATITRVRIDADPVNAGGAIITIASAAGPVSGGAVTNAQTYIDARIGITEYPTVQSAIARIVTAGGAVYAPVSEIPGIQAAASAAWATYLAAVEIGAEVSVEKLIQVVIDAGGPRENFLGWTLNTLPQDLVLAPTEVPVPADTLTNELIWIGT